METSVQPLAAAHGDLTTYSRSDIAMDTVVTMRVDTAQAAEVVASGFDRAFGWFPAVEACCSRFDAGSELVGLSSQVGVAVKVSPLLLEAVAFAVEVARLTKGAFDPTIGATQQRRGFDRDYVSGRSIGRISPPAAASHRDVR